MNRRTAILRGSALAAGLFLPDAWSLRAFAAEDGPVVDTAGGKVRGAVMGGVQSFRGIPYGAPTSGAARFMPPQKAAPWTGVRDALVLGPQCPQFPRGRTAEMKAILYTGGLSEDAPRPGEDCLVTNVWTRAAESSRRRPVMVWIHGGAQVGGSGGGPWYDGTNLVREGDVVVVTLNHRLNAFGYLYLAELGGEQYADSGNVSMMDLVLALQWVRDNITAFGGDPNNVTIFGNSGGASKVSTLLAMPSATGLFHKAIVQSGSSIRARTRDDATKSALAVLAKLNIAKDRLRDLHNVPMEQLLAASEAGGGFGPVVDGRALPRNQFHPDAPPSSATVPLIIGSTKQETTMLIGDADETTFALTEETMRTRLAQYAGGNAAAVSDLVTVFRKRMPKATPPELFFEITTELQHRRNALTQCELKHQQGKAAVYNYIFNFQSPAFGGKYKALHASCIPFVFNNVDRAKVLTAGSEQAKELAKNMSRAWIAFARTGRPNHPGLPRWNAFTPAERTTMIFDGVSKIENDPFREERVAASKV